MTVSTRAPFGVAAVAALMLGFAGPAAAQAQSGAPTAPPVAAATDVSDAQLRTFIDAATEVQSISEKWQARAASTESEEEVEEVRRQATEEMVGAVEEKGMTVDEFNSISKAAEQDPQLKSRIVAMLQQR